MHGVVLEWKALGPLPTGPWTCGGALPITFDFHPFFLSFFFLVWRLVKTPGQSERMIAPYETPGGNALRTQWPPMWHCVGLYARVRQRPHHLRPRRRGVIPTKTPLLSHQLRGSSSFLSRQPSHVRRTRLALVAFSPNFFAFVDRLSIIDLVFMACTHPLCNSRLEWNFCGLSSLAIHLSHLSFHIRCADSDIIISNNQFSPVSGLPFSFVYTARPQPSIPPYVLGKGWSDLILHSLLASSHIRFLDFHPFQIDPRRMGTTLEV